jgi:hypothetical protein
MAEGAFPRARMQTSADFREYLQKNIKIEFDGFDQGDGHIGEALDEATGLIDEVMTRRNILTIRGFGLKIEADDDHKDKVGLFFDSGDPHALLKADVIAVNEPRTLKVVVPDGLGNTPFTLKIVTQSSAKSSSSLLKEPREVRSDFSLTAHD